LPQNLCRHLPDQSHGCTRIREENIKPQVDRFIVDSRNKRHFAFTESHLQNVR
jgi:hypothetical protein